jgi:tRNA(fMet)-specific endonuclease VapC
MIILDTDHLVELQRFTSNEGKRLSEKLAAQLEPVAITIITPEEQLRGWLAEIRRRPSVEKQIFAYLKLQELLRYLNGWQIAPWNEEAAETFESLRRQKVRIGTMDLKIASIALATGSLLLSRNTKDFEQVPGLDVEDWLTSDS